MARDDNEARKRGDALTPRQSFADSYPRRRREPQLQTPVKQVPKAAPKPEERAAPGEVLLTWRVDRLRERPLLSLVVIAVLVLLFAWLRWYTGSWLTTIVLVAVVVASLSQFLFPTTFTLYENGLGIVNLRKDYRPWSYFAYMRVYPDAIQIAPRVTGVRARWNRGTLVYFGQADREKIEAIIREKLGLPAEGKEAK